MTPPSSRSRAPGVLGLLAQGCMPALETLKIRSWSPEVGSYEALGQALSGGQLLMLRSLEIDVGRSHDTVNGLVPPEAIAALVSGLEAPCVQLRALAVEAGSGSVDLSQADASLFARTLSVEGGGLSRLEELKVSLKEGQAMFEALADGAPCARTLKALHLTDVKLQERAVQAFFGRLRQGAFPSLSTLHFWDVGRAGPAVARELPEALVYMATHGTPSVLTELTLTSHHHPIVNRMLIDLARVFEAGGLPRLVKLSLIDRERFGSAVVKSNQS